MEQTAQVTRTQHARMIGLLSVLWISDISLLIFAVDTILLEGPTVMIMFASEVRLLFPSVPFRSTNTSAQLVHDPPRERLERYRQVYHQHDRHAKRGELGAKVDLCLLR